MRRGLLDEEAYAAAEGRLAEPVDATTDSVSDLDLAALAQGPAAPVGADMGEAAPEMQLEAAAADPGVSPAESPQIAAQLEEAARRRLLGG